MSLISLSQFDSLAAVAAQNDASVASAASAAIRELAEQVLPGSDTVVIATSTAEPADDSYWFYIEDEEGI